MYTLTTLLIVSVRSEASMAAIAVNLYGSEVKVQTLLHFIAQSISDN
jgi:hypothetical protein